MASQIAYGDSGAIRMSQQDLERDVSLMIPRHRVRFFNGLLHRVDKAGERSAIEDVTASIFGKALRGEFDRPRSSEGNRRDVARVIREARMKHPVAFGRLANNPGIVATIADGAERDSESEWERAWICRELLDLLADHGGQGNLAAKNLQGAIRRIVWTIESSTPPSIADLTTVADGASKLGRYTYAVFLTVLDHVDNPKSIAHETMAAAHRVLGAYACVQDVSGYNKRSAISVLTTNMRQSGSPCVVQSAMTALAQFVREGHAGAKTVAAIVEAAKARPQYGSHARSTLEAIDRLGGDDQTYDMSVAVAIANGLDTLPRLPDGRTAELGDGHDSLSNL